jgi:molybdenum cofactor guanylyltransferase
MPSFSAVLLAGGKSTRMGRDKALLPVPNSNLLLWQRQLGVLEDLRLNEIFWSGPPRPGLPARLQIVPDDVPDAGPLAGICACLKRMTSDLLIVLAVDLPQMSSSFLDDLQSRCTSNRGVVPRNDEFFEPLAAIYPKRIYTMAQEHLSHRRYALQDLVREAAEQDLIQTFCLTEEQAALFQNWNEPIPG